MSRNAWKGEVYNDRMSHKSQQRAGFHYSDSDYDEDEGANSGGGDAEETNEQTEFDYAREDHSSISSEQSYDQYGQSRLTSRCSSVGMIVDKDVETPDIHGTISNGRLPSESGSGNQMEQYSYDIRSIKKLLESYISGDKMSTNSKPSAAGGVKQSKDSSANYLRNFLADFWAHVEAGIYSAKLIPEKYR
ncbi:hypothetical protein BDR06DRAFT_975907 [Suillus hirtellus]|nr:hypothetical protein BDR06DRAFT_975907 [Suillus hirtellus]